MREELRPQRNAESTPPMSISMHESIRAFKDISLVEVEPRSTRIDPATITEGAIQSFAELGDRKGGLEFSLLKSRVGAILFSGSRDAALPLNPEDDAHQTPWPFPFSLFLYPGATRELKKAHREIVRVVGENTKDLEWFAHWHPRGSAKKFNKPSRGDIETAMRTKKPQIMIDEQSLFVYDARTMTEEEYQRFSDETFQFTLSQIEKGEVDTEEGQKKNKQNFVKKIQEYGVLYNEIPFGTPESKLVIKFMCGTITWETLRDELFSKPSVSNAAHEDTRG